MNNLFIQHVKSAAYSFLDLQMMSAFICKNL